MMGSSNVLCVSNAAFYTPLSVSASRSSQVHCYCRGLGPSLRIGNGKRSADLSNQVGTTRRRVRVSASKDSADNGQTKVEDVPVPGWAKPDSDELPPWAKNEKSSSSQEQAQDIPFPVYLIGSTVVAIAAVGSVFEYFNRHPVFGVIQPDSAFYAPILGLFAITGLPTSGFLFYKSIQLANKASEEADKEDGVRR